MFANPIRQSRRNVIVGAGLGLALAAVAACTTSVKKPAARPAGSALTSTADVPVGSAVVVDDVVVSQPTAGTFEAFSAVCPHAGCNVSKVVGAVIVCPCHGSEFNLDGSVAKGPAAQPLAAKAIKVQGDSIILG